MKQAIEIEDSWREKLSTLFQKPYFEELREKVRLAYQTSTCYPKGKDIFNAFNYCSFENTKVVIIGQDPYHGPNQAHGLSFSVQKGIPFPPSLRNIFLELKQDLNCPIPSHGDLTSWAKQGVLLLNATLTVEAGKAGSHQRFGWENFTNDVIKTMSQEKDFVVFLLWGGYARKKKVFIDESKHAILECAHPSPLSANRGGWFGNKHFSKTNDLLSENGMQVIDWQISD